MEVNLLKNDLEEKIANLKKMRADLKVHELKMKKYQHQSMLISKKKHIKDLIAAGTIIEKAGVLDIYDPDKLLKFICKNRNKISR